jgi:hypothetical protein
MIPNQVLEYGDVVWLVLYYYCLHSIDVKNSINMYTQSNYLLLAIARWSPVVV